MDPALIKEETGCRNCLYKVGTAKGAYVDVTQTRHQVMDQDREWDRDGPCSIV